MKIIQTKELSREQHMQVSMFLAEWYDIIDTYIPFPYNDVDIFLLLANENNMIYSIMGLIMPPDGSSDEEPVECIAYTHPVFLGQGYFSLLLKEASLICGERDILFPVNSLFEDTEAVMEAIGADCVNVEHKMFWKYDPDDPDDSCPESSLKCKVPLIFTCKVSYEKDPDDDTGEKNDIILNYTFYETSQNPDCSPAAKCMVRLHFAHRDSFHASFYDFHVNELCRGYGVGESAFYHVLKDLILRDCTTIALHVSGNNYPAISIYKKAGFRIIETLYYYMY